MRSFVCIRGMLSCCLKPLVAEHAQDDGSDDHSSMSSSANSSRKEAPSNAGTFQKEPRPKVWKDSLRLGVVEDRQHPAHVGHVAAMEQQLRKPKAYDDETAAFDLQRQQCQHSTGEGQNGHAGLP